MRRGSLFFRRFCFLHVFQSVVVRLGRFLLLSLFRLHFQLGRFQIYLGLFRRGDFILRVLDRVNLRRRLLFFFSFLLGGLLGGFLFLLTDRGGVFLFRRRFFVFFFFFFFFFFGGFFLFLIRSFVFDNLVHFDRFLRNVFCWFFWFFFTRRHFLLFGRVLLGRLLRRFFLFFFFRRVLDIFFFLEFVRRRGFVVFGRLSRFVLDVDVLLLRHFVVPFFGRRRRLLCCRLLLVLVIVFLYLFFFFFSRRLLCVFRIFLFALLRWGLLLFGGFGRLLGVMMMFLVFSSLRQRGHVPSQLFDFLRHFFFRHGLWIGRFVFSRLLGFFFFFRRRRRIIR